MAEYLKRCEIVTRMKSRSVEDEDVQLISSKKMKFYSGLENEHFVDVNLVENPASPAADKTSGSSSSDDELTDLLDKYMRSPHLEIVDLKSKDSETETSTSTDGVLISREVNQTSNICGESQQESMDSSYTSEKKPSPSPIEIPVAEKKMPSAAELEEFFAAAEKCEQKRFAQKYNYDIGKDAPLEGRYEWVRLQQF